MALYGTPKPPNPISKQQTYSVQRGFGYGTRSSTTPPPAMPTYDPSAIGSPMEAAQYLRSLQSYRKLGGDFHAPEYQQAFQAARENPYAKEWGKTHGGGGYFRGAAPGLKRGIQFMASREGRIGLAKVAAVGLGGTALAGGFGAAGAAGAGGAGAASAGFPAGYAGAGPWMAGAGAAGAAGAAGGTMAASGGFPWAAALQGGSQLLSGYMNKRASDKARGQQQQNLQAALAQLSPEAIRQLVQMFYTQNYAMLNPQMQSAQRGLASGAARSGLTGAGVVQQLKAGIPGQFANMALNTASQQGMGAAGLRARIQAGQPIDTPYSFGNDLQGIMQMLGRYGILRENQKDPAQDQSEWWIRGPKRDM